MRQDEHRGHAVQAAGGGARVRLTGRARLQPQARQEGAGAAARPAPTLSPASVAQTAAGRTGAATAAAAAATA